MPEEIWSRSHSRFDLYEGGVTALRSVYEVDFALAGIAVEVQLAVFVLVEVSLHGLRKLDIENPIIRINTAFKGCSSLEKISVLPRIYHN